MFVANWDGLNAAQRKALREEHAAGLGLSRTQLRRLDRAEEESEQKMRKQ
jgi:hypothetical protein